MVPPALFHAPKLKVLRGKKHIDDFAHAEREFWGRTPYIVVQEPNFDGQTYSRIIRVKESIPTNFSLIIGDAVHNIRSALDLLAIDLVLAHGGNTANVCFPFSKSAAGFRKVLETRMKDLAAPDILNLIHSLKPYPGGNHLLNGLHELDIVDKHKLIIPVGAMAIQPTLHLDFVNDFYVIRDYAEAIKPVRDGEVIDISLSVNVGFNERPIFEVAFGEGHSLSSLSVRKTLNELAKLTDTIIDMFASYILNSDL